MLHTVVGIVVYWQQIIDIANNDELAYSGQRDGCTKIHRRPLADTLSRHVKTRKRDQV